ncbi:MAG: Wzz/FepE/Etk N-terminal domain-containing protein [Oscillospiraceae bacterium]|nr:Wzz/FepE/Etk N-terminal domain-containing protein [Oscillospiraceae bacterium]
MKTIKDILLVLRKQIKWIAASFFLMGLLAAAYTVLFVKPVYSSSASLYVINGSKDKSNISTSEISASQLLVKTYIVVMKSETTLQQVSKKLDESGYTLSVSELRGMISASAIDNTEAFSITSRGTDKELVRVVTSSILDVLPDEIVRVVGAGNVNIIDNASYPGKPVYPLVKNIQYGLAAGLVISVAAVLLQAIFDTKVHSESQLKEEFDIAVIGRIPQYFGNAEAKDQPVNSNKPDDASKDIKKDEVRV